MTPALPGAGRADKYRVVVVDDHPVVRHGIFELFSRETDMEICGEASDVAQAMETVTATNPDLVIVDISLEGDNGVHLIRQIRMQYPQIRMLVASVHDETVFAPRAIRAGAHGYVSKAETTERFLNAVRTVLQGRFYVSPDVALEMLHHQMPDEASDRDPIERLTNRELEIFELIGMGLNNREISVRLKLSPKTIDAHRKSIRIKLDLQTSLELTRRACLWVQANP